MLTVNVYVLKIVPKIIVEPMDVVENALVTRELFVIVLQILVVYQNTIVLRDFVGIEVVV